MKLRRVEAGQPANFHDRVGMLVDEDPDHREQGRQFAMMAFGALGADVPRALRGEIEPQRVGAEPRRQPRVVHVRDAADLHSDHGDGACSITRKRRSAMAVLLHHRNRNPNRTRPSFGWNE